MATGRSLSSGESHISGDPCGALQSRVFRRGVTAQLGALVDTCNGSKHLFHAPESRHNRPVTRTVDIGHSSNKISPCASCDISASETFPHFTLSKLFPKLIRLPNKASRDTPERQLHVANGASELLIPYHIVTRNIDGEIYHGELGALF